MSKKSVYVPLCPVLYSNFHTNFAYRMHKCMHLAGFWLILPTNIRLDTVTDSLIYNIGTKGIFRIK